VLCFTAFNITLWVIPSSTFKTNIPKLLSILRSGWSHRALLKQIDISLNLYLFIFLYCNKLETEAGIKFVIHLCLPIFLHNNKNTSLVKNFNIPKFLSIKARTDRKEFFWKRFVWSRGIAIGRLIRIHNWLRTCHTIDKETIRLYPH